MIWCEHLAILCQGKYFSNFGISEQKNCHEYDFRRLEAPDVTGSSLTLAAAGSRRTVYLIDEIAKLPDTTSQSDSEVGTNNRNNTKNSNNNTSTNSNNNNNHASAHDQSPSTFVMYNRISNVIGEKTPPSENTSNGNGGKDKKNGDEHVWYEYGCV